MSLKKIVQVTSAVAVVVAMSGSSVATALASHRSTPAEPTCTCSASVRLQRPEVRFINGVLHFIPRVDVTLRTRGDAGAPDWSARLAYEGNAEFASEDVSAPGGVSFSGSRELQSGQCGNNRFSLRGLALSPVALSGVTPTLVGDDQELTGKVTNKVRIEGCGDGDEEHRMFTFRLRELGKLFVGGWRSVR